VVVLTTLRDDYGAGSRWSGLASLVVRGRWTREVDGEAPSLRVEVRARTLAASPDVSISLLLHLSLTCTTVHVVTNQTPTTAIIQTPLSELTPNTTAWNPHTLIHSRSPCTTSRRAAINHTFVRKSDSSYFSAMPRLARLYAPGQPPHKPVDQSVAVNQPG
jgi:hypothetical protein